jgi:alpha-1,6-mannosyltransferase
MPAAGASLPVAVWCLKSLSTACCLVALSLIARAAPAYGHSPGRTVLLVGANPLLATYAVGGGHNDLIVLAAACAAILLLAQERRPAAAGGMLALATAVKVSGALLLPFALAASSARRRFVGGALAAGIFVAGLAVATFGTHLLGTVTVMATNDDFVADYSGPDTLGRLLGTDVTSGVRLACAAAAAPIVLICLRRAQRGADWLGAAALAGIAVLCAIPSLAPWYVAWVLPAAALARDRPARIGIVLLTVFMVITRLPILGVSAY